MDKHLVEVVQNLRAACAEKTNPASHVSVTLEDFVALVEASGTDCEGYRKAAAALKGGHVDEPLAVQAGQLLEMLDLLPAL